MNVQKITPHAIDLKFPAKAHCKDCREPFHLHTGYADLDGKPFDAYYCEPCGRLMRVKADAKLASKITGT